MAKTNLIELEDGTTIPILYEDRAVLAIDKPAGWILAPSHWDKTGLNLQLALESSIKAGDFWARSRGIKFLRFIHRLDAGTTGILLCSKSAGALQSYSQLFETRRVEKHYLAVVQGIPKEKSWTCDLPLAPVPNTLGLVRVDRREGKEAQTHFRVVQTAAATALIEAQPTTGRTHQIRVHLAEAGHPVLHDPQYGAEIAPSAKGARVRLPLALRAIQLSYPDPFQKRLIRIEAPFLGFAQAFGFTVNRNELFPDTKRLKEG